MDELVLAAVVGLFRGGGDGVLVGRLDEEYAAVALGDALGGVALAAKDAGDPALHVGVDARGLDGGQHLPGLHAVADADVDFVHHPAEGSEYELGVAAGDDAVEDHFRQARAAQKHKREQRGEYPPCLSHAFSSISCAAISGVQAPKA